MSDVAYSGPLDMRSDATDLDAISFLISQRLSRLATSTLVKVMAVTNDGGVSPIGTVDVQPLVAQIDGAGNPTPHSTIFGLPYIRLAGGTNAVIIDPQVGDIGYAGFCSTDISQVKASMAPAGPGSRRRFAWADGVYLGGVPLGVTPTRYIQFNASGITIVDPGTITLQAPTVAVTGNLTVSGTVTATGDVTANGVSLETHLHSGVTTGSGESGPPV